MALCQPIIDEARKRIGDFLEKREADDRAECEAFGIPFHASAVWQSVCHLAMRLNDRTPKPGHWSYPSADTSSELTLAINNGQYDIAAFLLRVELLAQDVG